MKTTLKLMLAALFTGMANVAQAAGGNGAEIGFVTFLFLGFIALVVVFQLIPGLILFFSLLKGLFTPVNGKQTARISGTNSDRIQ